MSRSDPLIVIILQLGMVLFRVTRACYLPEPLCYLDYIIGTAESSIFHSQPTDHQLGIAKAILL